MSSAPSPNPVPAVVTGFAKFPELQGTHSLFSTQTRLAIQINESFYHDKHFVYAAPFFGDLSRPGAQFKQPASSSPCILFRDFRKAFETQDKSAAVIKVNRTGLRAGVAARRADGTVTSQKDADAIIDIIDSAPYYMFEPVVLVIPCKEAINLLETVPITAKPSPFSQEYVIPSLSKDLFQMMDFLQ